MTMTNKRKRTTKRRVQSTDLPLYKNMPSKPIFNIDRMFQTVFTQPISDTGSYIQHALTDMPQLTDFTNAFQEYRIVSVEVSFSYTAPSTQYTPTLYLVQDNADIVAPTSLANILSVQGVAVHDFSLTKNQYIRRYSPAPQIGAYQGAGLTGYALDTKDRWLSTQYPNIVYYGMKYWLSNYNTSIPNQIITYRARYHVQVRGFK